MAASTLSDGTTLNCFGIDDESHQTLDHTMESAVNKVEALFQKAESDLDYMSRKLEVEFTDENLNGDQINPSALLSRLHQVKKDYGEIVKETEELKKAQVEAAQFFQTQLMTVLQAIKKLEAASGHEIPELSQDEQQSLQTLGLPVNDSDEVIEDSETVSEKVEPVTKQEKEEEISEHTITISRGSFPALTAAELRLQTTEFVAVTQEEFESVSTLVRGRVKLEDVNRVYSLLHEHFKDNSAALSVPEMTKMGMRVTGSTGTAKLKVLRSLKLLVMGKDGSVKIK